MKSMNELTIVIPAKNEEKMIGTLLTSLTRRASGCVGLAGGFLSGVREPNQRVSSWASAAGTKNRPAHKARPARTKGCRIIGGSQWLGVYV